MIDQNRLAPIVVHLNVEEVVDGAWDKDDSLLPALSSTGNSPVPAQGGQREAYRRAYEGYVRRFTDTINRLAERDTPGQVVLVETGDVLLEWFKGPISSFDDPLFEEALELTPLPTRDEIENF